MVTKHITTYSATSFWWQHQSSCKAMNKKQVGPFIESGNPLHNSSTDRDEEEDTSDVPTELWLHRQRENRTL